MMKITQEELVKYLYHETSAKKSAVIAAALEADWNLREAFENLAGGKINLEETHIAPRKEVVNRILAYGANKQKTVHSHSNLLNYF
jgi:hypothetical protein